MPADPAPNPLPAASAAATPDAPLRMADLPWRGAAGRRSLSPLQPDAARGARASAAPAAGHRLRIRTAGAGREVPAPRVPDHRDRTRRGAGEARRRKSQTTCCAAAARISISKQEGLAPGSVDNLVVAADVLEHMYDPWHAMTTGCKRYLSRGIRAGDPEHSQHAQSRADRGAAGRRPGTRRRGNGCARHHAQPWRLRCCCARSRRSSRRRATTWGAVNFIIDPRFENFCAQSMSQAETDVARIRADLHGARSPEGTGRAVHLAVLHPRAAGRPLMR